MRSVIPPKVQCRFWTIKKVLSSEGIDYSKRFLEIGVGSGEFLRLLGGLGFSGTGIDLSDKAVSQARKMVSGLHGISIRRGDFRDLSMKFDMVVALEVLEHIKDDVGALKKMHDLTRKGGYVLLSVPAHQRKWGSADEFTGHVRRYERDELRKKLEKAGFAVKLVYNYGFPFFSASRKVRDRHLKRMIDKTASLEERTVSTGIVRDISVPSPFAMVFNRVMLLPFFVLQSLFWNSDMGDSYIVLAKKLG